MEARSDRDPSVCFRPAMGSTARSGPSSLDSVSLIPSSSQEAPPARAPDALLLGYGEDGWALLLEGVFEAIVNVNEGKREVAPHGRVQPVVGERRFAPRPVDE